MPMTDNQNPVIVTEWDEEDDTPPAKTHLWKKGQSGNILGRPKGMTLKEYVKDMLSKLNDEEKREFLMGMPKETIWRMAEGNPTEDKTIKITVPRPILGGISQVDALPEATVQALEEGEKA